MIQSFSKTISEMHERHRPSKHAFFSHLATCQTSQLRSPGLLDEIYSRYQAAMHATRVMAYFIPHLDAMELRMRKLRVLADDDGIPGGDSHHCQLRRTWTFLLGRPPLMADGEFGELNNIRLLLDPATAHFVSQAQELYPQSLGPWVLVEGLAHDWIGALLHGLMVHFPGVEDTDYFTENYLSRLEVRHAEESLDVVALVLSRNPQLLNETINGASKMATALDSLWKGMDSLLISP